MTAYSTASGVSIPVLNVSNASVTSSATEFIVPKSFNDGADFTSSFTKDYTRTTVSISHTGSIGVTGFLNDEITQCTIDLSIDRDDISLATHKLVSERKPKLPMMGDLSFDTIVKEDITGSFLDNMKEDENYNVVVDLKGKENESLAKFIFSGAKLDGVSYDSPLNSNKTASLKFSNYMDLENQTEGVFVSGKITSAISGSSTIYPQF